jgi:hypothetical protein
VVRTDMGRHDPPWRRAADSSRSFEDTRLKPSERWSRREAARRWRRGPFGKVRNPPNPATWLCAMNDRFGETVPLVGTAAMGALPPLNACGIYRTVKSIKDTPRILLDTNLWGRWRMPMPRSGFPPGSWRSRRRATYPPLSHHSLGHDRSFRVC